MGNKDVTDSVDFELNDDECLPLTKCVCGKKYDVWSTIIRMGSIDDDPVPMPCCGRKLFFYSGISVHEVEDA